MWENSRINNTNQKELILTAPHPVSVCSNRSSQRRIWEYSQKVHPNQEVGVNALFLFVLIQTPTPPARRADCGGGSEAPEGICLALAALELCRSPALVARTAVAKRGRPACSRLINPSSLGAEVAAIPQLTLTSNGDVPEYHAVLTVINGNSICPTENIIVLS